MKKCSMPVSYNLRERKRNNFHSGNVPPEAYNPRVCLERLKLLECHDIQNSRFYLQEGKIKVKKNKSVFSKKNLLRIFFTFGLLLTTLVYWRDMQTTGVTLVKKCADFHPSIHHYFDAVKFYNIFNQFKYKPQKETKIVRKPVLSVPKVNSSSLQDSIEIRQLVRDYFAEMKKKNLIQNTVRSSQSFIEEQCRRDIKGGSNSIKKKVFYNVTFHNISKLTDYALESEGAKILTVFNTEPYGTLTLTYLNMNLWPGLSHFLMKYLKCFSANGPNSILIPWKKPGDCWAFKGSQGRVQIKLSDEIVITAVTIDHIPKEVSFKGNIQSAPKKFSLFGVMELENKKIHLGSYEYKMKGFAAQTFFIQPKVEIPFRIVQVNFESNHGNEIFTCVYKVRIHGDK